MISERTKNSKRLVRASVGFAIPYALAQSFGRVLYKTNTLSGTFGSSGNRFRFIAVLLLTFILAAAAVYFFLKLITALPERKEKERRFWQSRMAFMPAWALIFLCWLPVYLAYYPGVFSYDIITQTAMIMEKDISAIIPPLHTFIWKIFLTLDDATRSRISAIVCYSVFQMLVFSGALSAAVVFTGRRARSGIWPLLTLVFFALNPVVAMMSFMTTKAVFFSSFFVLAEILLWDMASGPDEFFRRRGKIACLILTILVASLFRNNAVFSFLLSLVAVFVFPKGQRKKIIPVFAIPAVLYFLLTTVGFRMMGIRSGGKNELFPVQYQQIACVVQRHGDELTETDRERISQFTDYETLAERYNPRFSDPVKNEFVFHSENAPEFAKLWISLGSRYPGDYIDAALTLNLPYWYPEANSVDEFAGRDYIETYVGGYGFYWIQCESKIPGLKKIYDKVADFSAFSGKTPEKYLFSIACPIWGVALCLAILTASGEKKMKIMFMPQFFQWLIFVFGPVSNLRYIFPLMLLYPVSFAAAVASASRKTQ